jgi:hypothetical protein
MLLEFLKVNYKLTLQFEEKGTHLDEYCNKLGKQIRQRLYHFS